jgi:hypothetical protein
LKFGAATAPNRPWPELVTRWREVHAEPRIESLCLMVSPLTSHEPIRLARVAITLDDASGGRPELGLGSGGASERFEKRSSAAGPKRASKRSSIQAGTNGQG